MWFRRDPSPRNDDPEHEEGATGPFGRWFRWFVLGFAALLAATLAVWVLTGPPPGPAPVITAPSLPERRAPEDQTGLVPNQDQPIYESVAPGTETGRGQDLLAMPERPLDQAGVTAQAEAQDAEQTPVPAPESVPTPESNEAVEDAAKQTGLPPEMRPTSPERDQDSTAATPSVPSQPIPPQPPAAASPDEPSEQYRIQIASVRTEEQAAAEWKRVADRHPDLLSRLTPSYERFETNNSGVYYRVQGGPLIDEALAELLCAQLKGRKVPCIVISP